jgi:hypothetical protein|uniref:ORF10 n=1 Tax=Nitrosopumilaceae spindle-shaped virus TaxID=3065433 RepID=A0AAT9JHD5_9VIRU
MSKTLLVIPVLLVLLLVPTNVFAQTDFGVTSDLTVEGLESFPNIVMTPPQEIEITTPITGLMTLPEERIESFTFEKFQDGFTWELDEDGFLYQQWDELGTNPEPKPEYPQVTENYTIVQNEDGTYTFATHSPYISDGYDWKPYILGEDENVVQIQIAGGTIVFDKVSGAVTIFNEYETVIDSDSYSVRTALIGSDVWTNLNVNNTDVETTVVEDGDKVTVSFIRENDEGKFTTEYVIYSGKIKTTAYFTNYIYENNKFAFTQTLDLPDNIVSVNNMDDIDLTDYVGVSFDRTTLEENEDLILEIKDIYYNSGLGFDNLWSVNVITPTKVALDYANVEQTQTVIGDTVELDPIYTVNHIGTMSPAQSTSSYGNSQGDSLGCGGRIASGDQGYNITWNLRNYVGSWYTWNGCRTAMVGFDLAGIPDTAVISDTKLVYDITSSSNAGTFDLNQMTQSGQDGWGLHNYDTSQAVGTNPYSVYDTANYDKTWEMYLDANNLGTQPNGAGSNYASNLSSAVGTYVTDLGSAGNADVQAQLNDSTSVNGVGEWFGIGMPYSAMKTGATASNNWTSQTVQTVSTQDMNFDNVNLLITFSSPPTEPTNVTTTANGSNVDLSWSASETLSDYIESSSAKTYVVPVALPATWSLWQGGASPTTPTMGVGGVLGTAFDFNGSTDMVGENFVTSDFASNSQGSISIWIKPEASGSSVGNPFGGTGFQSYWITNTPLWSAYPSNSFNMGSLYSNANAFTMNAWNHVVVTIDSTTSNNTTVVYVNGSPVQMYNYPSGTGGGSASSSNSKTASNLLANTILGGQYHPSPQFKYPFDGKIDEVSSWDKVLSQTEVTTLYNSGNGNTPDSINSNNNLITYFPLDNTSTPLPNMAVTSDPVTVTYDVKRDGTSVGTTTNTSFTDTTTAYGTPYLFSLTASTSNGSTSTTNFPITLTIPAPTGLTATLNIPNVDLSWTGVSSATGYKIEHSTDGTTWSTLVANTGNTNTTYSDTVPTPNTVNYYQVRTLIGSAESNAIYDSTTITPVNYRTYTATASATTCDTGTLYADGTHETGMPAQNGGNRYCLVTSMEYDISAIPDTSTITSAVIEETHSIWTSGFSPSCDYKSNMSQQPSTSTTQQKWDSVIAGTVYANDPNCISGYTSGTAYDVPLSSQAITDIETQLSGDWFGINWAIDNFPSLANAGTGGTPASVTGGTSLLKLEYSYIPPSANATVGGVPSAPTGLTATFNTTTADIDLAFTAPANNNGSAVIGYKVEVSTDNATWSTVTADTGNTNTTYTDLNPTMGSLNYYKVSAINAYGTGAVSNIDNDMAGVPPDAPTITSTSTDNPNTTPLEITVNWTAPTNTGTAGITNYEVYRDGTLVTTVGNVTSYTDTVPTGGGTFVYSLKSVTPHGTSVLSATASHTTPTVPPAPTSAPTLAIANPDSNPFDVTLSWSLPSSGGSAITSFEVFRSTDDITYSSVGNTSQLIFYDTVPNVGTFYYKFSSINLVGNSVQSPSSNIATPTEPVADSSVTLAINSPDPSPLDITISIVAPSGNGGSAITGYNLHSSNDDITYTQIATNVTTDQTVTVSSAGTWYIKSQAINNAGTAGLGSATSITTPSVPTGDASVTLAIPDPDNFPFDSTATFVAPSGNGGSAVTGYNLYYSDDDITYSQIATASNSVISQTLTGAGTHYFKVESINNVGTSALSSAITIDTPTVPSSDASATLAINNPNPSPLTITATLVAPSSDGGSAVTNYNLWISNDDITYTQIATAINGTFDQTVSQSGTYYFKVESTNLVGTGGLGSATSIATPTVPTAPQNAGSTIADIDNAPYDVTVTWETPSSTGGSDLTQYNVYRKQGSSAYSLLTTTTGLSITDTVPTSLTTNFTYKIHSVNNVGESTAFDDTTITTFNVPSAPTLSVTTGTTVLSWNVPSSDATVSSYKIYRDNVLLTTVGTVTTYSDFSTIVFGNSYDFKIVAVSSLGDSADSNTVTTTPETEITGMVARGVTGTGAVIDWDEPAYYQGQVTSYNVYYGNSGTPATSAGTTTNTFSNFAPQLDYDTTYVFGVSINSPLGNSGLSNIVAITTNVDTSIVSADPTTGGAGWFDIDSVNNQSVNVIEFQRETQMISGNLTDTLQVAYPTWWDDMTCDVDYKFAQKTEQYVEGDDMTAQVNSANADQQVIGFQFQEVDNEVIEVQCAPQQSTQDDGVSAKYVMTQNNLGAVGEVGTPNIPIVTQITNFSNGTYGTDGDFGALNIVGLFAILISMVGFNRLNPIVGVLLSASMIFVLSWFGIITIPTAIIGAIALVIFLAWGATRNR